MVNYGKTVVNHGVRTIVYYGIDTMVYHGVLEQVLPWWSVVKVHHG